MLCSESGRFALLMVTLWGFVTAFYLVATLFACMKLLTSNDIVDRWTLLAWITAHLFGVFLGCGSCLFWWRQSFYKAIFISLILTCFTGLVLRVAS